MRNIYAYFFSLTVVTTFFVACKQHKSIPSLKETYSLKDKNPFGTYVFCDQVKLIFNQNTLNIKKVSFEKFKQVNDDTNAVYISITKNLYLSKEDGKAMLDFVADGNTIFLSSNRIDSTLLDSLGCALSLISPLNETFTGFKNTSVSMDTALFEDSIKYGYFYLPFTNHFVKIDTVNTRVLGVNDYGNNFIEVFFGKGKFFFHCDPRALSNYFLLQNKNYQYLQSILALTSRIPDHLYWDDFYNKRNFPATGKDAKTGISLLLQYPSMAWAFCLLLLLVGLYIFFGGKRRQRIVPVIKPNINTTIAFTETIGNLYLQKKDNRNIADKMILYFYEHLRKQYFLNTSQLDADFIVTLSKKSTVSIENTKSLFILIEQVQLLAQISDEQLLLLNYKIDNFYSKKI